MTFDEANKKLDEALDLVDYTFLPEHLDEILNSLKQGYAQTVEMTSGQAKTIMDEKYKNNLTGLLNGGSYCFDILFWEPLTEKQVTQAWLHQETIKVVDE